MRTLNALVLLLAACGGRAPVAELSISECLNPDGGPDVEPPSEELLLTAGEQQLHVAHRAHTLSCGHDLQVTAEVDEGAMRIDMVYEDKAKEQTNCTCLYDLAYRVDDLADGTWIVRVPSGLQAEGIVD